MWILQRTDWKSCDAIINNNINENEEELSDQEEEEKQKVTTRPTLKQIPECLLGLKLFWGELLLWNACKYRKTEVMHSSTSSFKTEKNKLLFWCLMS